MSDFLDAVWRLTQGNIITVAPNGNDINPTRLTMNVNLPFRTLTAAKNFATSGQTIVVMPGTYTGENNLLKDGVNWFFMAGATINYTDPGSGPAYGIFDDRPTGAVTCKILGLGDFFWSTGVRMYDAFGNPFPPNGTNMKGLFVMTQANSNIVFQARRLSIEVMINQSNANIAALHLITGTADVTCVDIIDPNQDNKVTLFPSGQDPVDVFSNAVGVYWANGNHYVDANIISIGFYAIWPDQPSGNSATSNLWITSDLIENFLGGSTIYYSNIVASDVNPNWKTWINVKEVRAKGTGFGAVTNNASGKHYLNALKIGGTTLGDGIQFNMGGSGEMWVTVQKIQPHSTGVAVRCNTVGANGTLYLSCLHYDCVAGGTLVSAGAPNLILEGGFMKVTNGIGIKHTGGTCRFLGGHIDTATTDTAGNSCCDVSAAGLVLEGTTLRVGPTNGISLTGTATVKCFPTAFTNKAKAGTITIQGTLTVDANLS